MAEQKAWTVTYTARRKVTKYSRRNVEVQVAEADVRKLLDMAPDDPFAVVDPQELEDAITEIAIERGRTAEGDWEETAGLDTDLEPDDVEIKEVVDDTMVQDLHATASDALAALEEGRLTDCRRWLQAMLDWLRPQVEDIEDKETPP